MGSVRATLSLVRNTVSSALIAPDRFDRILEVAGRFPDLITPHFICECRLGQDLPQVDLELCIDLRLNGTVLVQHLHSGCELTGWAYDPVLARFLSAWDENRHQLRNVLSHLWLEMNLDGSAPGSSFPGVFYSPELYLTSRLSNGDREGAAQLLRRSTDLVMGCLRGGGFVRSYQAGFRKVLDALPAGARMFQIGAMDTAAGPSLKLYVLNLDTAGVCPFLEKIGWPGDLRRVDSLLQATLAPSRIFALGLDICESLSPRLGIELYLPDDIKPVRELSSTFISLGCCEEAKARALESYPGLLRERETEDWPLYLRQMAIFFKQEGRGVIRKRINHFKLIVDEDRPIEAKVYLSAFQTWEM